MQEIIINGLIDITQELNGELNSDLDLSGKMQYAIGVKGDKGDKGVKGDKGDKGVKGDKGDKGDTGPMPDIDQTYNPTSENAQSGTAVAGAIATKVDKVTGKGLSSNDLTAELKQAYDGAVTLKHAHDNKTVIDGIAAGDITNWNAKSNFSGNYNDLTSTPTIDQTYFPISENAQSGIAVAQAIAQAIAQLGTHKNYGVKFLGDANAGGTVSRTYDAVGLVAGVGTDTETAVNDFDNIYPWSARKRCCGFWNAEGSFVVNAYKGEPGYAEDGSNGEVWIEHSLFYYKHTYTNDGAEEIIISPDNQPGFNVAPIFLNKLGQEEPYTKAYTAAYPMATVDGKATSRAGVFSDIHSLNTAMTAARTLGTNYTVTTTAEWYTECLYMWVEFATRNLQSVMVGASSMPYVATNTATVAESGANRIIVTNAVAAKYVIEQTILIGTSLGSSNVANNRIVTAIEDYDAENKAIVFDGSPVNIAVGNIVCAAAWMNGSCNSVLTSSGSPVSNSDGKHNCVYRGKETPYGNAFELISDILFKREGAGTPEEPYTYDVYFLSDPTKYATGAITADYTKVNYTMPGANGYGKKLGYDIRFPWLRIPSEIGAGTNTYYSDYYYYPPAAISAARVGGDWHNGESAGPCYWYCYAPSYSNASWRARLSYHRT
jgi:hypothetical protein